MIALVITLPVAHVPAQRVRADVSLHVIVVAHLLVVLSQVEPRQLEQQLQEVVEMFLIAPLDGLALDVREVHCQYLRT
jgi:hypothetical protein